jgi:hypothetical protein
MLALEKVRLNKRIAKKRIRKAGGDRLTGKLLIAGSGELESATSTELVYGMTQPQAEELVSGAFTSLHKHALASGQRPLLQFAMGGQLGVWMSYTDFTAYLNFGAAVVRDGSITALTVSVDYPASGGETYFRVFRKTQCTPPIAWTPIDGCQVILPDGECKVCAEFPRGRFPLVDCDEIAVGAGADTPGMVLARDGTVIVEATWD